MKVSMPSGVLFLLAAVMQPRAGNVHRKITCSMDWMLIRYPTYILVQPISVYSLMDSLYLGSGCSATQIQTYASWFHLSCLWWWDQDTGSLRRYSPFSKWVVLYPEAMHQDCHLIPLECSVSRKSVWLTPVSTDGIELDLSPSLANWGQRQKS